MSLHRKVAFDASNPQIAPNSLPDKSHGLTVACSLVLFNLCRYIDNQHHLNPAVPMVLHNDKWVKKAKRAVERRKGIRHSASRGNSGQHEQSREPLEVGRIASRDRNETLSDSEDSQESGDSPIEFDFGDEGKTKEEMETLRASEGPGVTRAPAVAEQRRVIEKAKDSSASIQDTLPATVDKRYARRKLFDNSARYEEAVLDPYILAQGMYIYKYIFTNRS